MDVCDMCNTYRLEWSTAENGSLGSLMTICDCQSFQEEQTSQNSQSPEARERWVEEPEPYRLTHSLTQTFISEQSPEERRVGGERLSYATLEQAWFAGSVPNDWRLSPLIYQSKISLKVPL